MALLCGHARARPLPTALERRSHAELFIVPDANGQALSYVYYESDLSKDEARRIALNIVYESEDKNFP
jgi:hypothetical protein